MVLSKQAETWIWFWQHWRPVSMLVYLLIGWTNTYCAAAFVPIIYWNVTVHDGRSAKEHIVKTVKWPTCSLMPQILALVYCKRNNSFRTFHHYSNPVFQQCYVEIMRLFLCQCMDRLNGLHDQQVNLKQVRNVALFYPFSLHLAGFVRTSSC